MKEVKAVLFDLDNTLYPYHENHVRGVRAAHKLYSKKYSLSFISFMKLYTKAAIKSHDFTAKNADQHDRRLHFQYVFELDKKPIDYQLILDMFDVYWDNMIKHSKLDPGTKQLLAWIKKQGYKVGMITDLTMDVQFKKIIKFGLAPYFDVVLTSEEAGIEKPSPKIFKLILEKLQVKSSETIMVGDNPDRDILGANKMRMTSVLMRRDMKNTTKAKPTHTITDIRDLKDILLSYQ